MSKLTKLYQSILSYCSMEVNDQHEVDVVLDDDRKPATIEGRRLVMPTEENLRNYHPEKSIVFHPLQEFVDRGESEVVKKLRHHLNIRINYTIFTVATALFRLVASPALHKELSPEQRELLLSLHSVDANTEAHFVDFVLKRYSELSNRFFTNIYLKKAGKYQGEKHARVGIVTFPYYEMLQNTDAKLRKSDQESFLAMIEFMFPESKTESEAYNNFSDCRDAPWLDALLKTSYRLTSRINELLALYKKYIEDSDSFLFDHFWVEGMDNIESYRTEIRRIPSQKGNEGTITKKNEPERSTIQPVPQRQVPVPVAQAPVQAPMQYPQQPAPGYPQQHLGYPPQYGAPGYPPPVAAAPPGLQVTESGKLDFRSVVASVPAVAMAAVISQPLTEWQLRGVGMQQGQQMAPGGFPAQLAPTVMYQQPQYGMDPRMDPAYQLFLQQQQQQQQFYQQQQMQQPQQRTIQGGFPVRGGGIINV